ncbi:MAG: ATPase [Elusimicrobia bacterium]|nr:ATPase [Elusimicrobiota bacterium]
MSRFRRELSIALALAAVAAFFASQSPEFLGARNLSMLVIELSITATLALGMFLILLAGHIDLSVGSGVGLIGGVASVLVFQHHWPAPLALALGFGLAVAVWLAMGSVVVLHRMPSFIVTLGGLLVFKGLFWLVISSATVPVAQGGAQNLYSRLTTYYLPPWAGLAAAALGAGAWAWTRFAARRRRRAHGLEVEDAELAFLKVFVVAQAALLFAIVMNRFRGVPLPAAILGAVTLGVVVLTQRTPFGRYLYAIGGNPEAAVVSGIPVDRVVIGTFGLMGALVAVTGFMQTAYGGASTTTVGELMELDAVAACVIGGTSLRGGRGTALGVLLGALMMSMLLNGMTLLAVTPEIKLIARGAVLTLSVWLDASRS